MARLFGRDEGTSDMNPQITRWGRLVLIVLGVLIVGGLVAGTFIYGLNQRNNEQSAPSEEVAQTPQEPAANSEASQGQTAPDSTSQTPAPSPQTLPSQPAPAARPGSVPNTGPEDWAPFVLTAVIMLGWYMRKSQRRLHQAQRNI